MSVKSFKFVSPGVFINEIDNSFIPKSADAIGPVVIGRATRGLAMQPVKVESFSDFVTMFGDTVPGNAGGDISRDGNAQSPIYGTYAAKAFLNANVAPVTYVRLLGQQDSNGASGGVAGWQTSKSPAVNDGVNFEGGGAFGMWLFSSASLSGTTVLGTGSLAAIWYLDRSASVQLTGTLLGSKATVTGSRYGTVVASDSSYNYTVILSQSQVGESTVSFNFDDSSDLFIRKAFNTNPQLTTTAGTFYPNATAKNYWLGETFEQEVRDNSLVGAAGAAAILPIALSGSVSTKSPAYMRQASREAVAGWFIGQDLGASGSFNPELSQKLFRLKGRGHGEWLHKNVKVSISKLRKSTAASSDYGTFSVILRKLNDTDSKVEVLERFDNCTLDPTSPNFVARLIGDKYTSWDSTNRMLKTYGEYPNMSKFVYVEMNADVEAGATDPFLLPYGYFGPPKIAEIGRLLALSGAAPGDGGHNSYLGLPQSGAYVEGADGVASKGGALMALGNNQTLTPVTGALSFPTVRLRVSASDGGLSDPTKAYFGMQTTREAASTRPDLSVGDFHRYWSTAITDDPTSGARFGSIAGIDAYSYVFSMNDISASAASAYSYQSGSRRKVGSHNGAVSVDTLLGAGYDKFTAPFWGGFDGWNLKLPDPLYNAGIASNATNINSYEFYTYKRAIDTVADPEVVDMNLLTAPGLTHDGLTGHMIDICDERADSLAVIDLASVYIPPHEEYKSSKADRIGTTPTNASTALRNRRIDSSYGCTFYPWVQTRDEPTGQLLWVPPSVVMLGVLASSQAKTDVWFAPAGFNRGGLTDGAAGITVTGVTERLTSKNRDTLYEARINPIASFPSSGIVVFGQKTLQERASALDRINVRRLVIYLKKQISILSTQILFEQNVQATWNRFKSLVEPFLTNVKTRFGITDYRLILDESTTTPDLIDQNILYAKIMIKPARAIEFIAIDFVIASTGASFDD